MARNFLEETYNNSMGEYNLAIQEADLNFQRAQANGDVQAAGEATRERAALLVQAERYHRQAVQHAAALQPAAGASKFGLSEKELEIARTLSAGAPDLSDEDRQRIYANNKAKLAQKRATGEYDDRHHTTQRG